MAEKTEMHITGMTCQHCVMRITKAVEGIEGVSEVKVDLASGKLEAQVDSDEKVEKIREAIIASGYQVAE